MAYSYPHCDFPFTEWNPVQKSALPYFTVDCNLVCSASVASGKTAIAEAIFGYELASDDDVKVVYVSPLKAIGKEKFDYWKKHDTFGKYKKVLVSSDTCVTDDEFARARMIVSTIESVNVHCRRKSNWLSAVKVLVFDEAHLIGDKSRGVGSEAMIMALSMLAPQCRLICLSGTLSNHVEVAKWLKNCNGKQTQYIKSDWRPTKLITRADVSNSVKEYGDYLIRLCQDNPDDKILIFVHSKCVGELLLQRLRHSQIYSAFYHAGLSAKIKQRMTDDFSTEYSGLNILISTSGLSMGVTL